MRISDWSSDVCSSDLFADPAQRGGSFVEPLVELLDARRGALTVAAAVGSDTSGLLGAVGSLLTASGDPLRGGGQLRGGRGDLADLHLLGFDFPQGAAGVSVESANGIAQLQDRKSTRLNSSH